MVTLGQVAKVSDTYEKLTRIVRVNGERGLRVAIRKQADANTVEVAKRVLAEIEAVNRAFPQIRVVPVINQGNFIERSIANVARSVLYGGGLAVLVLLFFLRNLRSTLVISLAIPISVVATFALIYFGGFTLNLMTLGGLALGVGMMVDSSVVVLENIFRRRRGTRRGPARGCGGGRPGGRPAIIASTITTLVIFLPLSSCAGCPGVLFRELAYVIIFSLVCSLLVALSLVPMLASKLLAEAPADAAGWQAASAGCRRGPVQRPGQMPTATCCGSCCAGPGVDHRRGTGPVRRQPAAGAPDRHRVPAAQRRGRGARHRRDGGRHPPRPGRPPDPAAWRRWSCPRCPRRSPRWSASGAPAAAAAPRRGARSSSPWARRPNAQRSNVEIADDLRRRLEGQVPGMKIRTRAPQGQFLLERILGGDGGLHGGGARLRPGMLGAAGRRVAEAIEGVPGITDVEISRERASPSRRSTSTGPRSPTWV